ncbi:DNA-processing protein DprA [Nibricoccus sp. IMCC34717]|uniref:DNA-processing protein DprA n=1 Tax=Nibricoccus sp. IMCC34717 TaxID=3034021 RepID=UPI003850D0FA
MADESTLTAWQAALVLNGLPNVGPITVSRLLAAFDNDPVRILGAPERMLRAVQGVGPVIAETIVRWTDHFHLGREEARLTHFGAEFLPRDAGGYPPLLRQLPDAPIGLYRIGGYSVGERAVAIVGSRRTTPYGVSVCRQLAKGLAEAGFCIVSGLARGIDTAAHEAALEAGGKTVAVLGCGADICYPPENAALHARIVEGGAVLSEFPLGRRADRQTFAMRNRIVAGMCRGVIVVETDTDGGSMITAQFAAEQNRHVFAVPGRIDQTHSRGCHQLIREGATLCTGVSDVLRELDYLDGLVPAVALSAPRPAPSDPAAAALWQQFASADSWHPDELAERCEMSVATVSTSLFLLEMEDYIVRRADGRYSAK